MASLQELRKRLRSIQSTGQLAGAMRTAATAKYAKLGRVREDFRPYAAGCREMLRLLGGAGVPRKTEAEPSARDCCVILSSNRGLCGGFNAELGRFLDAELSGLSDPVLLVCGKKAAQHLRERGFAFEEFAISDVPTYGELRPAAERLRDLYRTGAVGHVYVIFQRFKNMLTQIPTCLRLLPEEHAGTAAEEAPLFLPDRASIAVQVAECCLDAALYDLALENAAGAQAATMMAMRSACENAETAAADLQTTINRRRQADVTASVIETASGSYQQGV